MFKQIASACATLAHTHPKSTAAQAGVLILQTLAGKADADGISILAASDPFGRQCIASDRKWLPGSSALAASMQQQLLQSGLRHHIIAILDAAAEELELVFGCTTTQAAAEPGAASQQPHSAALASGAGAAVSNASAEAAAARQAQDTFSTAVVDKQLALGYCTSLLTVWMMLTHAY